MAAATTEVNTPEYPLGLYRVPVAASTRIFAGVLVALNNSGFAVNAADAANLRVIGRAEETVDNSSGSAGDASISVKRGIFAFDNDSANAVAVSHIGRRVFVLDNQTVQSATGTNSIVAGLAIGFENGQVIVDTTLAPAI